MIDSEPENYILLQDPEDVNQPINERKYCI
jgi:hypothetical protein